MRLVIIILSIILLTCFQFSYGDKNNEEIQIDKQEDVVSKSKNIAIKNELPVMYYFYGKGCVSCEAIKKEIDNIPVKYKGRLTLKKFEVWYNTKNRQMLLEMAKERGVRKSRLGTPTTVIGQDLYVGNRLDKIESIIKKNIK